VYDIPLIQKYLNRWKWPTVLPFCPTFDSTVCCGRCQTTGDVENNAEYVVNSDTGVKNSVFSNKGYEHDTNGPEIVKGTQL